jgi:hypothetical protein
MANEINAASDDDDCRDSPQNNNRHFPLLSESLPSDEQWKCGIVPKPPLGTELLNLSYDQERKLKVGDGP